MARGRRYDLAPVDGFRDPDVAYAAAALDEETERLYDLLADLPAAAITYVPGGTNLSIARLCKHMIYAEISWIHRITGRTPPEDLTDSVRGSTADDFDLLPADTENGPQLIGLSKRMRTEYSTPALAPLPDSEARIPAAEGPSTVREVLLHIIWHWTYHTGQIGLIRLLGGADYQWSFHTNTPDHPPGPT